MDIVEVPMQSPCQHSFCKDCITNWIEQGNGSCPVDRQKLSKDELQSPRILHQLLNRFTIRCKNYKYGCRLLVKLEDMPQLIEHEHERCPVAHDNCCPKINLLNEEIKRLEQQIRSKNDMIMKI